MSDLHLIVRVPNGLGWMNQADYEALPEPVKEEAVEILAVCPTEGKARAIYEHLPQEWDDDVLIAYQEANAQR